MGLLYKKQITMKKIKIITLLIFLYSQAYSQNIAFMKMECPDIWIDHRYSGQYLNNAIVEALSNSWSIDPIQPSLIVKPFSNTQLFTSYNNKMKERLTLDQLENLKMFNYDYIILHRSEKTGQPCYSISGIDGLNINHNWQSEFVVFSVNTDKSTLVTLAISSFDCGTKLGPCSNIDQFAKAVKVFVQENRRSLSNKNDAQDEATPKEIVKAVITNSTASNQQSNSNPKKKKSFFRRSDNSEGKLKVVRAKERNQSNNQPVAIDVYDKSLSLKVGDNIIITRTDEVKIPGEKKTIKSETTIGKAKITEDFNNSLYTAKLVANAGFNMKDYKDGDENYNAVKGEANKMKIDPPKIMVIPKKIDPSKYVNGEYLLSKEEKMLISAFKNKFEDNKFTTYGFESTLKPVLENRQMNDNVQDDIKSKILEAAGMDFFVEYENLDQNNPKCDKVFDFKIRNYSTGEDVASDVKNLNSCGTPDDYKNFAATILNSGAISKINTQFSSLLNNGRKVSVIFTISNASQTNFNKEFNGFKLKDHIENCLQGLAFNGNLDIEGVVNLRMETTINIPITNENTGKSYTTNTFSEDIIGYLKKNANVDCESSVSKQIVNIKIK
jgi:hypothetical protein